MSGHGSDRESTLLADAIGWRDRVLTDVKSARGRAAADAHQLPIELIVEAVGLIAAYIARGELVVSRRETIGELCGPRQSRRVEAYLEERCHIEPVADRDLFRPLGVRPGELPIA
jgi:hypothetical protein